MTMARFVTLSLRRELSRTLVEELSKADFCAETHEIYDTVAQIKSVEFAAEIVKLEKRCRNPVRLCLAVRIGSSDQNRSNQIIY